jgi:hypothetical protein
VIPALDNSDRAGFHGMEQTVFLIDASRPNSAEMFQRLRLAGPGERRAANFFNEPEDAACFARIGLDPITQIVESFRRED